MRDISFCLPAMISGQESIKLGAEGDSVAVVKGLKVKGAQSDLKVGTRVKSILLCEGDYNND